MKWAFLIIVMDNKITAKTRSRYSAFCASPSFNVPAFPVTSYKIAIFIARASPSSAGRALLGMMPQPPTFGLPLAGPAGQQDATCMGKGEGEVVTRELVKSWIEALGYAKGATSQVWAGMLASHEMGSALLVAPHLVELLETFDTLADVKKANHASSRMSSKFDGPPPPGSDGRGTPETGSTGSGGPARKRTKWVKGGRSVDAPSIKPLVPFLTPILHRSLDLNRDRKTNRSCSPFDETLSPGMIHMPPPSGFVCALFILLSTSH